MKKVIPILIILSFWSLATAQTYNWRQKRDPFVNLLQIQQKQQPTIVPPDTSKRPPGLPGLLISEVTVVGTASNDKQELVILRGTDNFTYMAGEGAVLLDGYLDFIERDQVVFIKEVKDTSGGLTKTKVVKQYYTETR